MKVDVDDNHRWLAQFIGEWTFENEASMGPDQPPQKLIGTESVRGLGDIWILGETTGEMPDGEEARMLLTLGYDPPSGRFVGSWIGSMMTHLWIYSGALDKARKVLTLDAEGPDMSGKGITKYQDIHELVSSDHRTLRSRMLGSDGEWYEFMVAHFHRKA